MIIALLLDFLALVFFVAMHVTNNGALNAECTLRVVAQLSFRSGGGGVLTILILGFVIVLTMGTMLAPALAALVFSFLMQGLVGWLESRRLAHIWAVNVVFAGFLAILLLMIFVVFPLVWEQVTHLLNAMPGMVRQGQSLLVSLPQLYPGFVSEHQVALLVTAINRHIADIGQWALSFSLSKFAGLFCAVGLSGAGAYSGVLLFEG